MLPLGFLRILLVACALLGVGTAARAQFLAERVATGFDFPVNAATRPLDASLFVVEVAGRIKILQQSGGVLPTPFLDITDRVLSGGERGLLGLAFPPDYWTSGFFYVNYTRQPDGATVISRFETHPVFPLLALPESEEVLFTIPQPASNHNAGHIAFGPDGYLYIPLGDGGDTFQSQDWTTPLGGILRIDVVGFQLGFGVPLSNPGIQLGDVRLWAIGLRNPYRWSFDRQTGDLFIGDVGASTMEEVSFTPASSPGGQNYGWHVFEGSVCQGLPEPCDPSPYVLPVIEYPHALPRLYSVVGGYRYRGGSQSMVGLYFFADFYLPLYVAEETAPGVFTSEPITVTTDVGTINSVSAFAEDVSGELYFLDAIDGEVYRMLSRLPPCDDDLDNDGDGDVDWDGGSGGGTPDAECGGVPTASENAVVTSLCGLGAELVVVVPALAWLRRRVARSRLARRR